MFGFKWLFIALKKDCDIIDSCSDCMLVVEEAFIDFFLGIVHKRLDTDLLYWTLDFQN